MTGNISKRHEMPLQNMIDVEVFNCWGVNFVDPFCSSFSNEYIIIAIEFVSKWVEVVVVQKDDTKIVIKFLKKNIFPRFGVLHVSISDMGTYFCNA